MYIHSIRAAFFIEEAEPLAFGDGAPEPRALGPAQDPVDEGPREGVVADGRQGGVPGGGEDLRLGREHGRDEARLGPVELHAGPARRRVQTDRRVREAGRDSRDLFRGLGKKKEEDAKASAAPDLGCFLP